MGLDSTHSSAAVVVQRERRDMERGERERERRESGERREREREEVRERGGEREEREQYHIIFGCC